ncbi:MULTISPECIES: nitrate- and nitrite sensing domain-containing protein [unclassified Streptomyces]|uniref:nitrate- and nitrite sensing domain-containing protein n=1 Tax=unclassified Streptomyces TaxID=2593676 RepID=UPI000748B61E|nr:MULTISPECIES: nitrate- and nitrite sensing domain-containing protein [unclassified Streptomyces]KUL70092.1 histidine kinase [Streptomyces sp. NRRL WC-3604]KUL70449.1 histidine kinase [Streptomyces sp. NRRL WC-3605]
MRFRGKSIRRKMVALLLVPLVSLTAIWGFATVLTGREVAQLFTVSSLVEKIGYSTEDAVRVIQQERRQALVYLADRRASDALSALRESRKATDAAIAEIRGSAEDSDVRDGMDAGDTARLTAVLDAFDGIGPLRRSVEDGTVKRAEALHQYNLLVEPCYALLASLDGIDDVAMDKEARALLNITRARELLSREDALLSSALVVGRLTRDEIRDVSDLVAQRTLMYDLSLTDLPSSERERFQHFWKNGSTAPLRVAEQSVIFSQPGRPSTVDAQDWDAAAGGVLDELGKLNDEAGDRYQDRVRPVAMAVIVKAVVAGVLGLLAVLFSLFLSVRIGRGLVRDLRQLRLDAHEASGVRLPSVMRRLSAGEHVDVETEVPRLAYDKNEIGEVGQALNTLQRAAVEAAVKQAELRAGVSEVFVNLARRSQVLLHKQLTLLDTMERRTEDTDELADLFRLDHLTTRMRRHAEGLVILSGAAPSRQWRKPVQLMDVVRAAVAEVEDYERIEVRRLPRVAVTGPAVADLTHLVAELLENATMFSPPHTAVQVLGERVANGFTLEIHDRGLGMAAEALLDANLRLAETPEFELSDTDRLGLFVVSRLAQRQNVRVSLQPSPYGGTTAVVFIPDALLTDDVPDTNGIGFRLDRPTPSKEAELEESRRAALSKVPARTPGLPAALLDGPVELEAPVDLDALSDFPDPLDEEDGERGGLFHPRRAFGRSEEDPASRRGDLGPVTEVPDDPDDDPNAPVSLLRRRTPKLVSSHGRPVTEHRTRLEKTDAEPSYRPSRAQSDGLAPLPTRRRGTGPRGGIAGAAEPPRSGDPAGPGRPAGSGRSETPRTAGPDAVGPHEPAALTGRARRPEIAAAGPDTTTPDQGTAPEPTAPGTGPLPRRVRQASLAPQLKKAPAPGPAAPDPGERDADEVRSRMASLQRGWQRGRKENAAGDDTAPGGTAPQGTTEGDGR